MEIKIGRPLLISEQVLHTCDNPPCCNPEHLYIGTPAENMRDKMSRGRHKCNPHPKKGEAHRCAKLTEDAVSRMKILRKEGMSFTEIGRMFGVHKAVSRRAILGITWKG